MKNETGNPRLGKGWMHEGSPRTRYHQPTDDLTQSIDWPSTGEFAEVASGLTRAAADDPRAPAWYAGDFFGNTFAEPEARRAPKPAKK